jgi:hypothetical protein
MIRYLAVSAAFLGTTLCLTAATAGTYSLCIGEYWLDGRHFGAICPAGQPYAYCGTDPMVVAAQLCRQEGSTGRPTVAAEASHGGNKCGYVFYLIICQ